MGTLVFQATLGGAVNIIGPNISSTFSLTLPSVDGTSGQTWTTNGSGVLSFGTLGTGGGGTGLTSFTSGSLIYASSSSALASSAVLAANALLIGGGVGVAPSSITTGTGVVTALGVAVGFAGAFVVNGGALGTPSSGTATNLTGLPLTTGVTGTLPTANGGTNLTSFTSGGVVYASSTSALATGSNLTYNGTALTTTTTSGIPLVVTGTGSVGARIIGGTGAGLGSYLSFQAQGANAALVGTEASIFGSGTSNNLVLYGYSTNSIIMAPSTAEVARFTSTGLGIGTSSPAAKLDVVGTGSNAGIKVRSGGSTGISPLDIADAAGNNPIILTATGNFGIGTSSPSSKLESIGTITSTKSATLQYLALALKNSTQNYGFYIDQDNAGSNSFSLFDTTSSQTALRYFPSSSGYWQFYTNNVERMRLDSAGNLGLGVTPSAWGSSYKALQIPAGSISAFSTSQLGIVQNAYDSGAGTFVYATTAAASRYLQTSGQHAWYYAASGTAGNPVTWTQAVTIDPGGRLLVGLTSNTGVAQLQVSGAIRTTGFTVATLPAGTVGMRTYVTDALAPSFSATVVGGGAVTIPVFYNGTNWIVA